MTVCSVISKLIRTIRLVDEIFVVTIPLHEAHL